MNRHIFLISSLLLLQFPTSAIEISSTNKVNALSKQSYCQIEPENGEFLSNKQLQTLASQITVKVIGDNNGGSGTLIGKQGNNYLVVTNSHVMRGVNSVNLQTSDGKNYSGQIVSQKNFKKSDLVLLKFQSNQSYCLPDISATIPDIDTTILAAGFSGSTGKIIFSEGKVKKTANLKEGYEIGYSSNIEQGMSGGAILNSMGQLIGINGKSSFPILNSGYVYKNGSRPGESEIREMRKLSWGIPISTVLAQVNQDTLTAYKLPLPATAPNIPEEALTGWLGNLEQKAKQFTVRIDSSSSANGSGIIIAKEGNTYTVLTSAHVLCESENVKPPCPSYSYEILASDGKKYPVDKSSIKIESGVDLAVVKFKSSQSYEIATLANYNHNDRDFIFTAGYPKLRDNDSPWRFTIGRILEKEQGLISTIESDFQNNTSANSQVTNSLNGGYELVYSSITYGGMSGGPVLDSLGRVIGIHGRVEGEEVSDSDINSAQKIHIGHSLGIPISTFFGLVPRLGVKPQQLENNKPPQLNAQQKKSIEEAVLSVDVSGGNATASQWLERGNQLWRLQRYKEAVGAFDKAIKQKSSFAYFAYYGKGLALGGDGKYKEAVTVLESAVKLKPDFVPVWSYLSLIHRQLKQPNKALIAINKAIELQPKNPNLYNEKWVVLNASKRYKEAEIAISKAIDLAPRAGFYSNRGNLYYRQKKFDLALDDFNEALKINSNFSTAYSNRGLIYEEQKKYDLALDDYNKAILINSKYASAYNNRGNLYREQKKWNLALTDFNEAILIDPKLASVYNNRGNLYFEQEEWDLALADFNKAILFNINLAEPYNNRGNLYHKQKKWNSALADFNKAILINPKFALAYSNRGNLYSDQQKWDLALTDFNKAIQINPNLADPYSNQGNVYYNQKKLELAFAAYNKAIQVNPKYANAYNNRGKLYYEQKKWGLALSDYNKAIQINPNGADTYNNRGIIYFDLGKSDLALVDYNKAIQLNPNYAEAYYNRGIFYSDHKKLELAFADYNKAIKINPNNAHAYSNRGKLYSDQQKWDLALTDFNKAIQINLNLAEAYNNRGSIYYQKQNWDLALVDFNKALQINPKYANAYAGRGLVLIEKGNKQKAIRDFRKAAPLLKSQGNIELYKIVMSNLQRLQK